MTRLELGIAWRYLRSRRGSKLLSLISTIAIAGVAVAVSALIVIMGVMNGLQTDLRDKILIASPDIRITTYGEDLVLSNWRAKLAQVQRMPNVAAAGPFATTQAVIRAGHHKYYEGVMVHGLPPDGPGVPQVTSLRQHAVSGDFSFATLDGLRRGVVLGQRLARRLDVVPGVDSVTLMTLSPETDPVTGGPVPHGETFEVTGIFNTGLYEYDDKYVIMSLSSAQSLASLGTAVTGLEVRTASHTDASDVAAKLADTLGMPYYVQDWQQQNSSLFNALRLEKLGMAVILFLIVLVAAFNIISTLVMVVSDKTKEIGILRTMGMPARSIRRVFFAQGIVIGLVGTTIGLVVGLAASELIGRGRLIALDPTVYFIDHLPVATQPTDVVITVLVSLAITAVATLYPARQAARLYPVEAIRHE